MSPHTIDAAASERAFDPRQRRNRPSLTRGHMVDLRSGAARSLPTDGLRANFPMAIDRDAHRVLVAFRSPPSLVALASSDGRDCR
jgi:hypothetical protein